MKIKMDFNHLKQLKKTILITEDQDSNFQLLEFLLGIWGLTTIRARNGQEAIDICKKNKKIDLILMDIRLPDISGLEATRSIKAIQPGLPIIAHTAYAIEGTREDALKAGCEEFITKPVQKEHLFELLQQFLE